MTSPKIAEEKPLHVRVAEALGWTWTHVLGECPACEKCKKSPIWKTSAHPWQGRAPNIPEFARGGVFCEVIPRYDLDWSATGPLIEKYAVNLDHYSDGTVSAWVHDPDDREECICGLGPTPLIAVCNLILELLATKKLALGREGGK